MQVAPVFNGTAGYSKEVKFETFPDVSFVGITQTTNGVEYSHDGLSVCNSIKYITYKMSVKEMEALGSFEVFLRKQGSIQKNFFVVQNCPCQIKATSD